VAALDDEVGASIDGVSRGWERREIDCSISGEDKRSAWLHSAEAEGGVPEKREKWG